MSTKTKQQYEEHKKEVEHQLRSILCKLKNHSERFEKEDWNWAFVGDLGRIKSALSDIENFMPEIIQ